jgi:hypothetical protein
MRKRWLRMETYSQEVDSEIKVQVPVW